MKIGTTRVETFSDGVMAIIITIMVLSLKIPDIATHESRTDVRHHLHSLIPFFIMYAFSFMMVAIFWINHHHMFHLLEKTDEPLLIQNMLFLFWMSAIPFSTAIMGEHPKDPDAVALYGLILLLTTLSFAIMRSHTIRKNLVHKGEDIEVSKKIKGVSTRGRMKSFIGTAAYFCAIPLAYLNVYLAYIIYFIPPLIFFIPDGIDDEKLAEKIEEKEGVGKL